MKRRRDLIVTNMLALVVLLVVLVAGWWDAAAFGLGVLLLMDLFVLLRERSGGARRRIDTEQSGHCPAGTGAEPRTDANEIKNSVMDQTENQTTSPLDCTADTAS